MTNNRVLRVVQ